MTNTTQKRFVRILLALTLFLGIGSAIIESTTITANAKSVAHSSRSHSSSRSSSSHSSSRSSSSRNSSRNNSYKATRNGGYTNHTNVAKTSKVRSNKPSNASSGLGRAYSKPNFRNSKPTKAVLNGKQNKQFSKTFGSINRGSSTRTYNSYFMNPYNPFYMGSSFYFYSWLFHSSYTHDQKQILTAQGIDPKVVKNPDVDTYWLTIKDGDEEKIVGVTKSQYDKIQEGQKISVSNGKVLFDGKEIK